MERLDLNDLGGNSEMSFKEHVGLSVWLAIERITIKGNEDLRTILWIRLDTSRRTGWIVCSSWWRWPRWRLWELRHPGRADKRPCIYHGEDHTVITDQMITAKCWNTDSIDISWWMLPWPFDCWARSRPMWSLRRSTVRGRPSQPTSSAHTSPEGSGFAGTVPNSSVIWIFKRHSIDQFNSNTQHLALMSAREAEWWWRHT